MVNDEASAAVRRDAARGGNGRQRVDQRPSEHGGDGDPGGESRDRDDCNGPRVLAIESGPDDATDGQREVGGVVDYAGGGPIHDQPSIERGPGSNVRLRDPRRVVELVGIPGAEVAHAWTWVAPFIERAARESRGRFTVEGIIERLLSEAWQLWAVCAGAEVVAVITTQIYVEVSGQRVAAIIFATGSSPREWVHLVDAVEDWARASGCQKLEMLARKGWARMLGDYKLTHILLERAL